MLEQNGIIGQCARIVEIRQRETAPLLKSFREWIDKTHGDVLPKSDLGDAFRYTLNQWDALNQFMSQVDTVDAFFCRSRIR